MAEAIGLGASILGIAGAGISVVQTLRKFVGSFTAADQRIRDLYSDVQLTADILKDLGELVQKYEKEYKISSGNFRAVNEACERNFERLEKALGVAVSQERRELKLKIDGLGKPDPKHAQRKGSLSAWEKLKFALGGEEELDNLLVSIETAKSNLLLLLDWLNLFVLRHMSKKSFLDSDQALDLKLLLRDLPALLNGMRNATFIAWNTPPTSTPLREDREPLEDGGSATGSSGLLKPTTTDISKGQSHAYSPNLDHNFTGSRDPTNFFPVPHTDSPIAPVSPSTSAAGSEASVQSPQRRKSVDNRSFYEGWTLERGTSNARKNLVVLCGLKLKTYAEDYTYDIEPFSRDAQMLKLWIEKFKTLSKKWKKPNVAAVSKSLDQDARRELDNLLERRNNSTSGSSVWKVAAIAPLEEFGDALYRSGWRNSLQKAQRWLIVIRGSQSEAAGSADNGFPNLYSDPWNNIEDTRLSDSRRLSRRSADEGTALGLTPWRGRRKGLYSTSESLPHGSSRRERDRVRSTSARFEFVRKADEQRIPIRSEQVIVIEEPGPASSERSWDSGQLRAGSVLNVERTESRFHNDQHQEEEWNRKTQEAASYQEDIGSPDLKEEDFERMMDDVLATFTQQDGPSLIEKAIT